MFGEAVAAVNRTLISRLERNFGFLAAVGADDGEHLAVLAAITVAAALVAAVAAARGLVLEAFFGVKFLFARAEDEFFTAVLAYECLVFESH